MAAQVTPMSPGPHRALSFTSHGRSGSASQMTPSTQPSLHTHHGLWRGCPGPLLPRWVHAVFRALTPHHLPEGSPQPHSCCPHLGLRRPHPSTLCSRALPGCSGSHSRPDPSSHSAGALGTASHTWRRRSAERTGGSQGSLRLEQPPWETAAHGMECLSGLPTGQWD